VGDSCRDLLALVFVDVELFLPKSAAAKAGLLRNHFCLGQEFPSGIVRFGEVTAIHNLYYSKYDLHSAY
jgi:hypothetical protein